MTKKILALVLALACVAGMIALAACNKDSGDTTTTAADETTLAEDNTTLAQDVTTAAGETTAEDLTTVAGETTVEGLTTVAGETTTLAAAPKTTEEIVAYFNDSVNGIKSGAKSVTHHYSKITLNGSTTLPGWADTVLKLLGGADKFIGDQLAKNSKGLQTYTGADIKNRFPVENEAYASKLTAADVKSATCTEANGIYTIKIVTVADGKSSSVQHGQGHAPKAFNVILPGVVNDNVPGAAKRMVGTAEMNYPSSTATITVDAATGHVLTATYDLKWTINFGTDVIIPFTTLDSYTINW